MDAVTAPAKRRTVVEIHRDKLAELNERRESLAAMLAGAPARLSELTDAEIRQAPAGTRPGATGPAHQFARKVEEARRELASVESEIGSRTRLLSEAEAVEAKEQMKMLRRLAQEFSEREDAALDRLVESVEGVIRRYAELVHVAEAKANALAGHSIRDADVAEGLREAFRPSLQPFPADAGAAFALVYEASTDAETRQSEEPVSEVGASLPDRHLDPAAYEEALANLALDRLMGNLPRPGPARARPIIRDREQVRGLERVRDLTSIDVTPRAVLGRTFSSKPTRTMHQVGTQFGGVETDRAWPTPGDGA